MKILHTVESYLPHRHGMSEVVKRISEKLVQVGHQVTVATKYDSARREDVINGVRIKSFNISGNTVVGLRGEVDSYRDFVLSSD
ncbi:MAG: hypothetical protein NXI00_24680, partial [Cytophagales bacterium]|nr:hypothetical protein [Cytophagales bacterium]